MTEFEIELFTLDLLPAKASLESEVSLGLEGEITARFRATRRGRWPRRKQQCSEWSGWFRHDGEPIALRWSTFWG